MLIQTQIIFFLLFDKTSAKCKYHVFSNGEYICVALACFKSSEYDALCEITILNLGLFFMQSIIWLKKKSIVHESQGY